MGTLTDADVVSLGFEAFDAAALKGQGVRLFGPGARVAQDLEPEYITVAQNNQTAYVTLQENNAVAAIDLFDSGDAIEREVARVYPANFNANNSSNSFDNRSDNKGPEPEGLALGTIGGRTYAFVGLERQGGVMIFDVSEPARPTLVQYLNSRNFGLAPALTDSGPEMVRFVKEGPGGRPLILLANETSGSVVLIQPD